MECVAAPSPNFDERPKDTPIDILIMHYTGMESADAALERIRAMRACRSSFGISTAARIASAVSARS